VELEVNAIFGVILKFLTLLLDYVLFQEVFLVVVENSWN